MTKEKRCGDCKYMGSETGENLTDEHGKVLGSYHFCMNSKSIYKACIETATRCNQYERGMEEEE